MIFHKFWYDPVGVRFQDMNIYTFWIDLDTLNPDLEESWMVWGTIGENFKKFGSRLWGVCRLGSVGDPCLLGDRPWRSTSRKSGPKQCPKLANT